VANAALRFRPPNTNDDEKSAPTERPPGGGGGGGAGKGERSGKGGARSGKLWIIGAEGKPQAVPVRLGLTDGSMTEITEGEIAAGAEVIAGNATPTSKPAASAGPRMF